MSYQVRHSITPNNETKVVLTRKRNPGKGVRAEAAAFLGVPESEVVDLAASASASNPYLTLVANSEPKEILCTCHDYQRTQFGSFAIGRLLHAGGAMDRFDPVPSNYLFITATLPGDDEWAKFGIAQMSNYIVDALKSWFSKRLSFRFEFYVWEHQERGALHLHYCVYVPDAVIQAAIQRDFRAEWVRLLNKAGEKLGCSLWGKYGGCDFDTKCGIVQTKVEIVYRSVAAYMCGYLSKGGSKHSKDKKHPYYPKRWFGVSRPLSEEIKKHSGEKVIEFTSFKEASEYYAKLEEDLLDEVLTHKPYAHKVGEGKTHVFYHTLEKQQLLWQESQMLNHSQKQHPNTNALIRTVLNAITDGSRFLKQCKESKELLCPSFRDLVEDSTYLVSLRRDAISARHLRAIQDQYSFCDLSTHSQYQARQLSQSLTKAETRRALYHHQMTFNQFGWLNNPLDFVDVIDEVGGLNYAGTSTEDSGTPKHGEVNLAVNHEHTHTPCLSHSQISLPLKLR